MYGKKISSTYSWKVFASFNDNIWTIAATFKTFVFSSRQEQTGNDCHRWFLISSMTTRNSFIGPYSFGWKMGSHSWWSLASTQKVYFTNSSTILEIFGPATIQQQCALGLLPKTVSLLSQEPCNTHGPNPGQRKKDHLIFLITNPLPRPLRKCLDESFQAVSGLSHGQPESVFCMVEDKKPWQKLRQALDVQFEVTYSHRSHELLLLLLDRNHNWRLEARMKSAVLCKSSTDPCSFPWRLVGRGQVSSLSSCRSGQLWRTCSVVCSASPQRQSGEGTRRSFLYRW